MVRYLTHYYCSRISGLEKYLQEIEYHLLTLPFYQPLHNLLYFWSWSDLVRYIFSNGYANFMLFSKYHLNSIEDIKTEEYRTKLYHLLGPQRVAGPKGNTGAQVTALLFL